MKTVTIRQKLNVALVIFASCLALVIALAIYINSELIERATLLEAQHVAEVIDSAAVLIGTNDTAALQAYLVDLNQHRKRDIGIIDASKNVLADVDAEEVGGVYTRDRNNEVGQTIADGKVRFFLELSETGGAPLRQVVVAPGARKRNSQHGVAAIILEYTPIRDELIATERRYFFYMINGSLGVLFFAVISGFIYSRKFARPLTNLNQAVKRVAALDYAARVDIESSDEIGQLGRAFNRMAEHLERTQSEIDSHQLLLESRIDERTVELTKSNALLLQSLSTIEVEKERALVTLQSIGDAVLTTDSQMQIEYLNPIAEQMTGWSTIQAKGLHMDKIFNIVNESTRAPATNPIRQCLEEDRIVEMENHTVLIRKTDQAEFHIEDSAAPIRLSNGTTVGAVMVFHDVTERQALQKNLKHIAYHDALTGLPNRTFFQSQLNQTLTNASRVNAKVAVLFLDLDHFKIINDSMGHQVGDQLLIQAAQRIHGCVRNKDVVARMGGDEFTAILEGIREPTDASIVAQNIIDAVSRPFEINGQEFSITASVGISVFPNNGEDTDALLKNADAAMYQAKYSGRNKFKFYEKESNENALEKLQFESHLKKALRMGEFFLEYQPKLNLQSGKIVGLEALVRWGNAELGRVEPNRFISILEETGLIVEVGEWVLRSACAQAKIWLDAGHCLTMAVNFSARQFSDDNLLTMIARVLSEVGLPAYLLELEITESLIMSDIQNDVRRLSALREMGIKVALDDFGTGYSSLSYLRRFPVDVLKIDKSFVDEIHNNASSAEIVKTIIDLGHILKMDVIAEGVETKEQAVLLKSIGCDSIQGYWFSRPVAAAELTALLEG